VGIFTVGEARRVVFLGLLGGWDGFAWLVGAMVVVTVAWDVGAITVSAITVSALVVVGGVGVTAVAVAPIVVVQGGGYLGVGAVVDLEGQVADAVVAR
jgi:hypothetical protein